MIVLLFLPSCFFLFSSLRMITLDLESVVGNMLYNLNVRGGGGLFISSCLLSGDRRGFLSISYTTSVLLLAVF